jgi:hypothetical protein
MIPRRQQAADYGYERTSDTLPRKLPLISEPLSAAGPGAPASIYNGQLSADLVPLQTAELTATCASAAVGELPP